METTGIDYSGIFGDVATEVTSGITAIAPIGVTIFGTVLAISIGIKVFGKLAKRG